MTKLFVLLLFLILSGSKQELLSDVDTKDGKKPDATSYACSSQLSGSVSEQKILPNEERSSQHISNEENKDDKMPTVLDCLVKIHEETVTESGTETTKRANLSSRRSPDIKYLIETKDDFRDFTTKRNRSKINKEPTIYIDIAEKCTEVDTKSHDKKLDSGRRSNNELYIDNIHETKQPRINLNTSSTLSESNLNLKKDINSTKNQNKIYMEFDKELSAKKVSTTVSPRYHDQILYNKVTYNPSTQKYVSSTILHENIPKDTHLYVDLGNKDVTDKPSTKKFDFLFSLNTNTTSEENSQNINTIEVNNKPSNKKYDLSSNLAHGFNNDSFKLLDFSNKEIGEKPSIIKYDLKTLFENKSSKNSPQEYETNVESKYEKTAGWLLRHDIGEETAGDNYSSEIYNLESFPKNIGTTKEYHQDYSLSFGVTDNPSTNNNDHNISTPKNNRNKDLLMSYDLSNRTSSDEDIKLVVDHHRDLTNVENNYKHFTNKYEIPSTPIDITNKNLLFNNNSSNATDANNIKLFISHHQDLTQKADGDKDYSHKYEQTSTPHVVILKDLFLYKDLGNKAQSNKNIKLSEDYYQDLIHKEDVDKLPTNKDEMNHHRELTQNKDKAKHSTNKQKTVPTPNDDIYKYLLLYHGLGDKTFNDKNKNIDNMNHQDLMQNVGSNIILSSNKYEKTSTPHDDISKDSPLHQNLDNKALGNKSNKIVKENYHDLIHKVKDDKLSSNKYEQLFEEVNEDLLPYHDFVNEAIIDRNIKIFKEDQQHLHNVDGDVLSITKYEQTSAPYDDTSKDLLLHHDLSNKANSSKNINFSKDNYQNLTYKEDSEKPFIYKYNQTSASYGKIYKDPFLYHDLGSSEANYKNNNITKAHYQDLAHKEDEYEYARNKNAKSSTIASSNIYNNLFLYHNLSDKIVSDTNANLPEQHHHDIFQKENDDKYTSNKSEKTFKPNDDFFKNLFLFLAFGNKAISDKNIKAFKDYYQNLTHKVGDDKLFSYQYENTSASNSDIYKDSLLHHDFNNQTVSNVHSDKENGIKSISQISKEHNKDLNYKKINYKPSVEKYNSSFIPKDDIDKRLLILHDHDNKKQNEKDSFEMHDLNIALRNNNNYNVNNQALNHRKKANKLSINNKYDLSYAVDHNIKKNLYPFQGDISNKEVNDEYRNSKYDLKFTLPNKVPKENDQSLSHKEISDLYAIKGSNSYATQKQELSTTVDIREPHLVEPTTGYSIKDLFKARVMLLESTRVCYACSSISDHSCWQPSRSTTVKYCRKGHNACLTKTFKTEESEFIVIRDCGTICDGTWPVLDARYKSCSICNEDMCNDHLVDINSGSINSINLLYFVSITVIINFMI